VSGVSIEVEIIFKDKRQWAVVLDTLRRYNPLLAPSPGSEKAIQAFAQIGLDGTKVFTQKTSGCVFDTVISIKENTIRFWLEGGLSGGYVFWQEFFKSLMAADTESVVGMLYDDLLGVTEFQIVCGGELFRSTIDGLSTQPVDREEPWQLLDNFFLAANRGE